MLRNVSEPTTSAAPPPQEQHASARTTSGVLAQTARRAGKGPRCKKGPFGPAGLLWPERHLRTPSAPLRAWRLIAVCARAPVVVRSAAVRPKPLLATEHTELAEYHPQPKLSPSASCQGPPPGGERSSHAGSGATSSTHSCTVYSKTGQLPPFNTATGASSASAPTAATTLRPWGHSEASALALVVGRPNPVTSNRVGHQAESLMDRGCIVDTSPIPAPSQGPPPRPGRGLESVMHRRCIPDPSAIA